VKSVVILRGKVAHGQKRGKGMGYPTINFKADSNLPEGVYISQTKIQGKTYNSITSIGTAKTFNETDFLAETHVFGFSKDIYGENVKVKLLKKVRGIHKFSSEEELISQMNKDKETAMAYFS